MRSGLRGLAAGALTLVALAAGAGVAQAQGPVLENGKTKAVYDYKQAVRERVFIPQPGIDQDHNGKDDFITADILRPAEGSATNKMPAIIDPSPYYTTVCRGNESQCMADWNGDNVNDRWPLFYDNYFVPRGYAYVLAQMNGTGYTEEGCPMHGGAADIAGQKSVVDWLNGRVKGYALKAGTSTTPDLERELVASWHNNSSAMIGKSYDGTLANGVAATGVEGLKTIVPISAISAWYNYSRTGGVRHNTNYPAGLNGNVTTGPNPPAGVSLPNRRVIDNPAPTPDDPGPCGDENAALSADSATNADVTDGDVHGDINSFWRERDHNLDPAKIKASVFAIHGFQDDNVRMDHMGMWWDTLAKAGVERKLWLLRSGHTDPFESRRAVWVDTLHRWFDHYLFAVNNGIQTEKAVTVEDEKDVWGNYNSWPIDGTQNVDLYLRGTDNPLTAGTIGGMTGGAADTQPFNARTNTSENTLMNNPTSVPTTGAPTRRVFLSRPLTQDVRLSGTATADLVVSIACPTGTNACNDPANPTRLSQTNLSVIIADYGAGTQTTRGGEGIANTSVRTCWGATGNHAVTGVAGPACVEGDDASCADGNTNPIPREIDNACYQEISKPTQNVTQWRVTRGIRDTSNKDSLWFADATPVTIDQQVRVKFPVQPTEHIFKAGHQIGIIVAGTNTNNASGTGNDNVPVTLDTKQSKITLPIQGGYSAIAGAQGTDAETVAPVLGNDMPADMLVATTDPTGTVVNYTKPTATDNEDPNPVVTCDPASGSKFAVGTTTVTCTARDANGNVSAPKTFNVVVRRDVPVNSTPSGTVPATLSLTLGTPAQFGAFTPGIMKTYLASTNANVISTAGDALLSVADPSSVGTGHLVNGSFVLAQPLQARARNAANTGTAYNNVGSSASPLNLLTWNGPVSNDAVTLEFSQLVSANDPLRTGTYAKALTFTLSTTTP